MFWCGFTILTERMTKIWFMEASIRPLETIKNRHKRTGSMTYSWSNRSDDTNHTIALSLPVINHEYISKILPGLLSPKIVSASAMPPDSPG